MDTPILYGRPDETVSHVSLVSRVSNGIAGVGVSQWGARGAGQKHTIKNRVGQMPDFSASRTAFLSEVRYVTRSTCSTEVIIYDEYTLN